MAAMIGVSGETGERRGGMRDGMHMGTKGMALLKGSETCKLVAYPDPGTGGKPWTIGWGHTGANVVKGMTCTQEEADAWLQRDLWSAEHDVQLFVQVPLTQDQFDALVDWTYNLGGNNLRTSTMLRKLNARDYASVPEEMIRWNQANGKVLKGLAKRREAEAKLWKGEE